MFFSKTLLLATIAAISSPASAWTFKAWADSNYKGTLVLSRSGNAVTNNMCIDIITNDNKMTSFQYNEGTSDILCEVSLWQLHGCKGEKLGSSTGDWNVKKISTANNDRVSSVWIDCL